MKSIPSQYLLIALLVIGFVGAAALLKWRRGRETGTDEQHEWPFYAKKPLSQPEQVLYHRLAKALPEHLVLAQVQVSRILGVKKGFNFHEWNNRVNRMSYDFVVCAKDARVLAVIELDDKTHDAADRLANDRKKDRATASAGLRLVRWHVAKLPDEAAISALFTQDARHLPAESLDIFRVSATDRGCVKTRVVGRRAQSRPLRSAQDRRSASREGLDDPRNRVLAEFSHGLDP